MLRYHFVIVGGPHDGVGGLKWNGDREHPTPDAIRVGECGPGMSCGTPGCVRDGRHVSYWTPDEADTPPVTARYEKHSEEVALSEDEGELMGRTVYVLGGLGLPPQQREVEEVGQGAEFGAFARGRVVQEDPDALGYFFPPATYAGGRRCSACGALGPAEHLRTCPFRST